MLRWHEGNGDINVANTIKWIENGDIAKIADGADEHQLTVVREPGAQP